MSLRADAEDKQGTYLCGRCVTPIFYLISEGKPSQIPCPDCGYAHGERPYMQLPSDIRIDLSQY